jgi:phospholipid/cholesterol/gamma-HCH transport system substrate-binding protein
MSGRSRRVIDGTMPDRRYLLLAAGAMLAIAAVSYWAFAQRLPFSNGFELRGQFSSANELTPGSPVRVAGVTIGRVSSLGPGPGNTSIVTMTLSDPGQVRSDASLAIRPRLALEGSFQVEVRPGTPEAPKVSDGALIGLERTSVPVQLDQVLSTMDRTGRAALRSTINESAAGLGAPDARQRSGADGMQEAIRELADATGDVRRASHAMQGERRGDLRRATGAVSGMTAQLARDPEALAGIVTEVRRVTGALAAHDTDLRKSFGELDALVRAAPADLTEIDRALPPTTRFVKDLLPALRIAPDRLNQTHGFLTQLNAASRPSELPATLKALQPVADHLPDLQRRLLALLPFATTMGQCLDRTVVPGLDQVVPDGTHTTGDPAWLDFLHLTASLAGASSSFDANGNSVRLGISQSNQSLIGVVPGIGQVIGAGPTPQGINPRWLGFGKTSPYRPDAKCTEQKLPDLGARHSPSPSFLKTIPRASPTARERNILLRALGSDKSRAGLLRELLKDLYKNVKAKRPAVRKPKNAERPVAGRKPAPVGPGRAPDRPQVPRVPSIPDVLEQLPEIVRKLPNLTKLPLLGGGR